VNPSSDESPRGARASVRMDARLDATTRTKVDDLARHFHRPRAAVVCHIMEWGLYRGEGAARGQGEREGPVRHLHLHVEVELHEHVKQAAAAMGIDIAAWLRDMVRHVTLADFPTSWLGERSEERSHDLPRYRERFMLRLDEA
jgi:hypothetical protein